MCLVTTPDTHTSTLLRRTLRAWTIAFVAGATLLAAPALADVPEGWSNPDDVDALHALLLLGGVPVVLFFAITLLVLVPALVRGEKLIPSAPAVDDQWFGGPRQGVKEIESGDEAPRETGGARGSW